MQKKYYDEINTARGLGVLIVLLGHSFPDAEIGVFASPVYQWFYDACYSFHMALFFLISGFVMGRTFYGGEYSFRAELVKKVKRLLVPYLFLSYISLLPKIFLNAYARNPVDTASVFRVLLGRGPNGSLWYLYTLFVFSVFVLVCGKFFKAFSKRMRGVYLLAGGILLYVVYAYAGELALQTIYFEKICQYLIFYALGIMLSRHYEKVRKCYVLPGGVVALGLVFLSACPLIPGKTDYMVTAFLGSYGIFVLADHIASRKRSRAYAVLDRCGRYSYDIYILSYYVQQLIRVVCFRRFGWDYSIVFWMELVLGFAVSYIFAVYMLRKSRLLKCLLIGMWEDKE